MTDVVIIGAGPAGMMAAYFAAQEGASVIVLEKNRVKGRKLRITGKGRCNLTNDSDVREVMAHIPGDGRFLYSALSAFPPCEVMSFFERNGLPLKTERGRRVFPRSDNANDVADLMIRICEEQGVHFVQDEAKEILLEDNVIKGIRSEQKTYTCRSCIISTGGLSYPLTGSTGDGYRFARQLGHTVITCQPSLVPLESRDPRCARLQGLSLRNVELRAYEDDHIVYRERGEMLFTHFGVSGPLVLSASAHMRHFQNSQYTLRVDLKPALDEKTLDQRIQRDFHKYQNKLLSNALVDLLPHSLIPEVLDLCKAPDGLCVNSVTKELRCRLVSVLKNFPVSISGTRPIAEAIVTAGGVDTREINPRTMESKFIHGLYFAGEVLNLDAYTGGYNLQIAWATGRMAGVAAGKYNKNIQGAE